ncbi:ethanolamine ammonia-lyase subunit EutC [Paraburkholderia dinghuensis]|uniref:Ethanolamine ammonia-lyase small subunit n=1 Tax=Paraburkholderia dinghuensis TaxID=2305225 RepID=A0A3N6NT96_9BURK|nr:ethanolamine ammonia-lyase subunit EutC [Paraburkholderia dinghuensis]RQH03603.1 ethanolamine ammonia-lyase subunit EutC [Paraburkholderia dinghuensis]
MSGPVEANPWDALRRFTRARIALGRAGSGLPTAPLLAFELAHAQARDAVQQPLDAHVLHTALRERALTSIDVHSAAPDRDHYLRRPDLGRRLDEASVRVLRDAAGASTDVVFVIADGLSSRAAATHALPLLDALRPLLDDWRVGPIVVARQSRVALGDEIGECLRARFVVMLIGERPGLSSPDSLGLYLTAAPRVGRTDAERNCISNVRPDGLGYSAAAAKLHYLLTRSRALGFTGVGLKDDSDDALAAPIAPLSAPRGAGT